ncbi:MAG: hypothetical protein JW909_03100 [Planctomycetes bacterium]|nr:hypothetical protein [Planctomycetota bacterium]
MTQPQPGEPEILIVPRSGESMSVASTGYGPGLYWCCHLREGRREVVHWFDSPLGRHYETSESLVTRRVRLLGRDCFEVWIREKAPSDADWRLPDRFEYFSLDHDDTHWIRPGDSDRYDLNDGILPNLDEDDAWELQDENEGVRPHVLSTDAPPPNSRLEVVDLSIAGRTTRCLRETFFEMENAHWYGGDAFRRADGTTVYYRRLLGDWSDELAALEGSPEYDWLGHRLLVWYSCLLVEEEG